MRPHVGVKVGSVGDHVDMREVHAPDAIVAIVHTCSCPDKVDHGLAIPLQTSQPSGVKKIWIGNRQG